MKKKLLLSFLAIFILFGIVAVPISFGYNLQYKVKANINSSGSVEDYLYRTYIAAHPYTVRDFPSYEKEQVTDINFTNPSPSWAYDAGNMGGLSISNFKTLNIRFHTGLVGNYSSSGQYGYTTGLVSETSVLQAGTISKGTTNLLAPNSDTYINTVYTIADQYKRMTLLATGVPGAPNGYKPYVSQSNPSGAAATKIYVSDRYITQTQINILKDKVLNIDGVNNSIYISNIIQTKYGVNKGPQIAGAVNRNINTLFS